MKLPNKQEAVIKLLLKEGMINSKKQIIEIAVFEYFHRLGWFRLLEEMKEPEGK